MNKLPPFNQNELEELIESYCFEFIEWFIEAPLFAQFLMVAGIIAIAALAITLVYYLLKGLYLLLKAIFKGLYELGKKGYKWMERELKEFSDSCCHYRSSQYYNPRHSEFVESQPKKEHKKAMIKDQEKLKYCSLCGAPVSGKMLNILNINGKAFCEHCGGVLELAECLNPINF